jgi:hypothetical protein
MRSLRAGLRAGRARSARASRPRSPRSSPSWRWMSVRSCRKWRPWRAADRRQAPPAPVRRPPPTPRLAESPRPALSGAACHTHRQASDQGGEHGSVGPLQARPRVGSAEYRDLVAVGARNSARPMRRADTRGSVRPAGRVVGRCQPPRGCGEGGAVGERPGRECGVAGDRCSDARTRAARLRRVVG